jgi:thymidylate synthase
LKHVAGFDQLDAAFKTLMAVPDSRQVVLQIWNGETDFPRNDGKPVAPDIPCNVIAMLKVRDGALEWTQIMRSNDLFRGFVHNVIQFTFLHEIMAGWLGLKPGSYHHFSDSLHLYDEDVLELDESSLGNAPENSDVFDFSKEDSDTYFMMIEQLVEVIISTKSSAMALLASLGNVNAPEAFLNIGRILVCEGLRRRGEIDAVSKVLSECSNQAYSFLYNRWLLRMNCPPVE